MSVIELAGAEKSYGAVRALRDGTLSLEPGEVRALVGENGAGKSTLVKLLAGVVRLDNGEMRVDGEPVDFHSPTAARDAGIAVIYQEPTLFPDLSIAENVVMGRHPLKSGRPDRPQGDARPGPGAARPPRRGARRRPPGARPEHRRPADRRDRQGAVLRRPRPDHGRADRRALGQRGRAAVHRGARLREEGAGVLFISHRLEEVFAICDTVTVMRDGAVVHEASTAEIDADELVRRMVGRDLGALFPKEAAEIGAPVLKVHRLTREGVFFDVSFEVKAGEIVALAGLVGAGRSEVARAVFGIDKPDAGHVEIDGNRLAPGRPLAAMRAGIGFVPEDRRQQGLVMDLSIARNATMTRTGALARGGLIRGASEDSLAREWAARLQLKFHRLQDPVGFLSGGNQQKVVLAKWLATEPKLLILDEPTRGIDVGTKSEVHRLMSELAGQGLAVLMISSELPEVLGMADRVLVMHEGRLAAEIGRDEANEENVIRAATGQVAA